MEQKQVTIGMQVRGDLRELTQASENSDQLTASISNLATGLTTFTDIIKELPNYTSQLRDFTREAAGAPGASGPRDSGSRRSSPLGQPTKNPPRTPPPTSSPTTVEDTGDGTSWKKRAGWLKRGVVMGTGFALGNSATGFITSSMNEYIRMKEIITPLMARIGNFNKMMNMLGRTIGTTRQEFAAFADIAAKPSLANMDTMFVKTMRLATATGTAPMEMLETGDLGKYGVTDFLKFYRNAGAIALNQGLSKMERGRFRGGDWLSVQRFMRQIYSEMYRRGGEGGDASIDEVSRIAQIPWKMFPGEEMGRSRELGMNMLMNMDSALRGDTGDMGHEAMLRQAYGLGSGVSYWDFLKRKERGITSEQNLIDIAKWVRSRYGHMSRDALLQNVYQGVFKKQLTPRQVEAFVDHLVANPNVISGAVQIPKELHTFFRTQSEAIIPQNTVREKVSETELKNMTMDTIGKHLASLQADLREMLLKYFPKEEKKKEPSGIPKRLAEKDMEDIQTNDRFKEVIEKASTALDKWIAEIGRFSYNMTASHRGPND